MPEITIWQRGMEAQGYRWPRPDGTPDDILVIPGTDRRERNSRARMAMSGKPDSLEAWLLWRFLARYDLLFLCRAVLGYRDVSQRVHGRLLANLQHFKPSIDHISEIDLPPRSLKAGQIALPAPKRMIEAFEPFCDMYELVGPRRYFNMIPRGHLKSTVVTAAHLIQWIINYPNVRILISTHTEPLALDLVGAVRKHFLNNPMFRYLFPEHVPYGKAQSSFGNTEQFNTCARTDWTQKESTVQFLTLTAHMAGPHYDVVMHDDLVDFEGVKTPDTIESTKRRLANMTPLIERRSTADGGVTGWEYLTGTFYDFSDANYSVWEQEKPKLSEDEWRELQALAGEARSAREAELVAQDRKLLPRSWSINVESAAPNYPEGPFLWPERYGQKVLREIEVDPSKGLAVLAAQYLMNPIPPGSGLIESKDEIIWTPRKVMNELYARLHLYVAVDLAGMEASTSRKPTDTDYTAITLGGFGSDGHLYVPEVIHGRLKPEQVIDAMFELYRRHPRIIYFKIEKEAHARVLLPFLKARMAERQIFLPIMEIQRDNRQSKQHKISGLQPWFKQGMIHFSDDLPCKLHIINEIMRFPKYNHDDILDTLCDLMASRDGGVTSDVMGRDRPAPTRPARVEIKGPDGSITVVDRPTPAIPVDANYLFGLQSALEGSNDRDEVTGY